jgi:purine-binding chemotaxis protein CheW
MLPLTPLGPRTPAEAPSLQLCAFFVGSTEYAVDIMRVDEILQPQGVTALPGAPAWVDGVMNLRGQLIPVVDLRRRLGTRGPPPPKLKPKWVVALVGRRRVALVVDGVSEVARVRREDLKPLPQMGMAAATAAGPVVGAFGPPDRVRLLLNIKAVLGDAPA